MQMGVDTDKFRPISLEERAQLRQTLGLNPVRHITRTWWHSPTTVIGMFPDWFAPNQPDWPCHVQLTGFPLFDELGTTETPPHVKTFLETGSPPSSGSPDLGIVRHLRSFELQPQSVSTSAGADCC